MLSSYFWYIGWFRHLWSSWNMQIETCHSEKNILMYINVIFYWAVLQCQWLLVFSSEANLDSHQKQLNSSIKTRTPINVNVDFGTVLIEVETNSSLHGWRWRCSKNLSATLARKAGVTTRWCHDLRGKNIWKSMEVIKNHQAGHQKH